VRQTGRLPIRYGLASSRSGGQGVFGCRAAAGLPANETTLAELLQAQGYKTHMIGETHDPIVEATAPYRWQYGCCRLLPWLQPAQQDSSMTLCAGKWHLGQKEEFLPPNHGFDSYMGIPYSVDMGFAYNNRTEGSWSEGNFYGCTPLPFMENTTAVEQPVDLSTVHKRYTTSAVDFVQRSTDAAEPFFLYMVSHAL
jgi:arylsulfatase A-like enzyme